MVASSSATSSVDLSFCQDPLFFGLPTRSSGYFFPLGKRVLVESNDEAVVASAIESFQHYGPPSPDQRVDIHIRICVDPTLHDDGAWPRPSYRAIGHLFHIACGTSNFAVVDLKSGKAFGFVSRELVTDRSFFRSTFLECAFYVLAVHQSLTPVHCSCVSLNDCGILICGPSGAGKTTLAYACAKAGMKIVSDDVVYLEVLANGNLRLRGNPWHLRLEPNTGQLFPELIGKPAKLRSDHAWYLEIRIEENFPGQGMTSCVPKALILLERHGSAPVGLTSLDATSVLKRLRADIFLADESVVGRHYAVLDRLAADCEAYTLNYSGHPTEAVPLVRSVLEGSS